MAATPVFVSFFVENECNKKSLIWEASKDE
jgi:hypothetical protein